MGNYRVNVYDDGEIIARVKYNADLDFWDGHNWSSGHSGRHKGLTKLKKSGKFVIIYGSDYQGENDWAEIITEHGAIQEILRSGNDELLDKFHLRELMEQTIETE